MPFEQETLREILRRIRMHKHPLATIDGPCASGKTTLAARLAETLHASVVHTDDYVVPHAQKTADRLAVPGGNCDADRLLREVILPWKHHLVSDGDEGEDKIEAGARREGKSAWEIASFYSEAFMKDYKALNCLQPEVLCPATEYIAEMIKLGVVLEKKGYAYATSDGIYFDTSKLPDYGKLAGRKHIEGIQEGHRVAVNSEKRNAADFAIWKFSPKDQKRQMEWHSPWG